MESFAAKLPEGYVRPKTLRMPVSAIYHVTDDGDVEMVDAEYKDIPTESVVALFQKGFNDYCRRKELEACTVQG